MSITKTEKMKNTFKITLNETDKGLTITKSELNTLRRLNRKAINESNLKETTNSLIELQYKLEKLWFYHITSNYDSLKITK